MKILVAALLAVLTAAAPAEFGTDWDDPRTAAPPIGPRHGCTTTIVQTQFRDFTPYASQYTPQCRGEKVTLRMTGSVKGRQFDRLGYLKIGGVTVFKTSTPEPSAEGISWSVEKDLSEYASLLTRPQPVEMLIGNVVDDTYTGVLDITVTLTFSRAKKTAAPDVLPVTAAIPRNTERLAADVYATGSGGGCEEFWYLTTPTGVPYSCPADNGPYREVQIRIDGVLAGIAAPYPHIYTGGWSNPFLWYVVPAPRAFDVKPIRYDLTPFVGRLTDGKPHAITVGVVGVPAGQTGWDVPTTLLAWRDPHSRTTTGALIENSETPLTNQPVYTDHQLTTTARHSLTVSGYVNTSHGRITTTITRTVASNSTHIWNADETTDALQAVWTDATAVTVRSGHSRDTSNTFYKYALNGRIDIDGAGRLTTAIALDDTADAAHHKLVDTWTGTASWTLNVPREQRHATGISTERYRLYEPGRVYDHTISTRNGAITEDKQ